jgi:ribose 5-phosphate isomerase RpiB
MYRELLNEFVKLADEIAPEELDTIAEAVLTGLDKMADTELDNLEKMANDYEEAMSKVAAVPDDEDGAGAAAVAGGVAALGAGAGAAYGLNKIKGMIPEWRSHRDAAYAAKEDNKAQIARKKADLAKQISDKSNSYFGIAPGAGNTGNTGNTSYNSVGGDNVRNNNNGNAGNNNNGGGNYKGNGNNQQSYKDKMNLTNRLNMNQGDATLLAGDAKALRAKDWLGKNKFKVLAGVGGAALLASQMLKNKQQDSELRGAYGVAAPRR